MNDYMRAPVRTTDVTALISRLDAIERQQSGLAGRPPAIETREVRRLLVTARPMAEQTSSNGHVLERKLPRSWAEVSTRHERQRMTSVRHWVIPAAVLTMVHILVSWLPYLWSVTP